MIRRLVQLFKNIISQEYLHPGNGAQLGHPHLQDVTSVILVNRDGLKLSDENVRTQKIYKHRSFSKITYFRGDLIIFDTYQM